VAYLLHVTIQGERLCATAEKGSVRGNVHTELTRLRENLATLERRLE
jgi:hypothetical protein